MSSVMLAAGRPAIEQPYASAQARETARARQGASVLQQAQGLAAGILFLAARVPLYIGALLLAALAAVAGVVLYLIRAAGLRLTRTAGAMGAAALALVCVAGPERAQADMVTDSSLLNQTTVVFSQQTNLYSFDAPSAGTLSISLKDWEFPVPLQQLTASILSQDQVLGSWGSSTGSGWQFEVPVAGSGLFDAFVAAQAGSFAGIQLGAYSMSITFEAATSPVPLPPALDLLLGGIGLLGAMTLVERISRSRNRDVISVA